MPGTILRRSLLVGFPAAVLLLSGTVLFASVSCKVAQPHLPNDAERAFLAGDFATAASDYQAGLASHPGDPELTAGLVGALLRQQKVREAADAVKASLAVAPTSAALISLRGEVELRQGLPWVAMQSAIDSYKLDPCNPRNHLLLANLERINSNYASSRQQLALAHKLDPVDPEIRGAWIGTLPLEQKIAEMEAYLSTPTGDDEEDKRRWRSYLESLKKSEAEPHKPCHLVSPATSAEIPLDALMVDANRIHAYGLDVKLNGHPTRLEIDTGAGGILVSRTVAEHAGLKAFSQTEMGGIGDQGFKPGYSAYADSIHIGNLEFQDCLVRVLDTRNTLDVDGLIGMDVFSRFLVTLDYPMHKLLLGALPPRPGESAEEGPSLKTSDTDEEEGEGSATRAKEVQDKPTAGDPASAASAPATDSGNSVSAHTAAKGPYDRYIAPEMKDYTKVYRVGHHLILPASLNGKEIRLFIMDTGAFTTLISPDAARDVTHVHNDSFDRVKGISGEVKNVYTADTVTFHFAHLAETANDVISIDTSRISKNVNMEISGFIGFNTLKMLTIHIDYRDGLVKFDYDPNRGYKF